MNANEKRQARRMIRHCTILAGMLCGLADDLEAAAVADGEPHEWEGEIGDIEAIQHRLVILLDLAKNSKQATLNVGDDMNALRERGA